jgi:hypothetical protein
MPRHRLETEELGVPQEAPKSITELGDNRIEQLTENDVITKQGLELEKFMNEPVTIRVHDDSAEGSLPVICPNVNGINQPIIRNHDQTIKRKYVEALARCRTTVYDQAVPNPAEPANIQMVAKTMLSYNFQVVEDKNPRGRDWLKNILAQP